jgi:hypothetical protein
MHVFGHVNVSNIRLKGRINECFVRLHRLLSVRRDKRHMSFDQHTYLFGVGIPRSIYRAHVTSVHMWGITRMCFV